MARLRRWKVVDSHGRQYSRLRRRTVLPSPPCFGWQVGQLGPPIGRLSAEISPRRRWTTFINIPAIVCREAATDIFLGGRPPPRPPVAFIFMSAPTVSCLPLGWSHFEQPIPSSIPWSHVSILSSKVLVDDSIKRVAKFDRFARFLKWGVWNIRKRPLPYIPPPLFHAENMAQLKNQIPPLFLKWRGSLTSLFLNSLV